MQNKKAGAPRGNENAKKSESLCLSYNVRFKKKDHEKIKVKAEEKGITPSEFVRYEILKSLDLRSRGVKIIIKDIKC